MKIDYEGRIRSLTEEVKFLRSVLAEIAKHDPTEGKYKLGPYLEELCQVTALAKAALR